MTDKQFLERMAVNGQCYNRPCEACMKLFGGEMVCGVKARSYSAGYAEYKKMRARDLLGSSWVFDKKETPNDR